jgi:hypothetical protein
MSQSGSPWTLKIAVIADFMIQCMRSIGRGSARRRDHPRLAGCGCRDELAIAFHLAQVLSFANPNPPDCRGIWPFSPRFNLSVIDWLACFEEVAQ